MKKSLLILFLAYFSVSYCQYPYKEGYYIENNGKRTKCFIRHADWRSNPSEIKYKLMLSDTTSVNANIKNISEFGIADITYKRFLVKIDRTEAELRRLGSDKYPHFKEETLFLKVLVVGKANLYFYMDDNIVRYFYETNKVPIEQLVCIQYLMKNKGLNMGENDLATYNQFWYQLIENVSYSDNSEKEIRNLKYQRSHLEKYFRKYNASKTL